MSNERIRYIILRTLGNFFLLFSIYGMVMTFGPAIYFEGKYRIDKARNVKYVVEYRETSKGFGDIPLSVTPVPRAKNSLFGEITGGNKVESLSPVSAQFGLVIPKIGANAKIFPNVDAGDPDVYTKVLGDGVAHAAGTVFPGIKGNIYLFAHSTDSFWNVGRYNAIFYLLKELENGDEIDVFFQGIRHKYRVTDKKVISPSETHYLTDVLPFEQLTLQTCWPPGTTLKRLIVQARPENEIK